jgi:non-canonical poly(A) RNA polymerase PAPD5/7
LRSLQSPLIRLHNEIVDFSRFLEPTEAEAASRAAAVERVRDVVVCIWPDARFEVHGSFATGMYLPSSDIDAVILDSGAKNPAVCLKALAISLARRGMAVKRWRAVTNSTLVSTSPTVQRAQKSCEKT